MKAMAIETMCIIGGMSILGYMFLKMNPSFLKDAKNTAKDMSRMIYNKLDEED